MIDSLFTSLKSLTGQGRLSEASRIFSLLRIHVASTNSYNDICLQSISSLLSSCNSLSSGKQLHAHVVALGFERNPVLVPKMVTFYTTFNLLVDAHVFTEDSNVLHALPWNLLIFSYVRNGFFDKALSAYKQMVAKGIRPDNFTYPAVLKSCGERLDLAFGREVHNSIEASAQPWSLFVHNALIAMYARFGLMEIARQLFDQMPERDSVSWSTMISAHASRGSWIEAFGLFERALIVGVDVNAITWNTIAGGWLRMGHFARVLRLIPNMINYGVMVDSVALTISLGACSHMGCIKLGKEIHGFAIRNGIDEFDNFKNALITMYSRCRVLRIAYIVFESIECKDVITWNSMLSGFTHMNRAEEASFFFREMLRSGLEPNFVTIASILPLCARVANLQHGKEFHCYIMKREGFRDYLLLWNAIVDMYARSGKVSEARRVFDSLATRDEVTYTAMIAGYGMQCKGQVAVNLFEEMNKLEIKPDHITMVAVLSACSHSGLVAQGKTLFENMTSVYDIRPRLEHFSCMVDLFCRAGLIENARDHLKNALQANRCNVGDSDRGLSDPRRCRNRGMGGREPLGNEPENSGYYVLISKMYASAGSWDKLAKVRTLMRDSGVRKDPGCAWVDVGNGFFSFLVGDASNPHSQRIYHLLDGLTELMRDESYVSSVEDLFRRMSFLVVFLVGWIENVSIFGERRFYTIIA